MIFVVFLYNPPQHISQIQPPYASNLSETKLHGSLTIFTKLSRSKTSELIHIHGIGLHILRHIKHLNACLLQSMSILGGSKGNENPH